jgi:small subunit ribosomal protein S16
MLTIRLQRVGKKKIATYRLVISEKARDTQDVYLEQLGTFNPHAKENQFAPVKERIEYWISKGAQTSDTVHNLLVSAGIIKGKKLKSVFLSKKRSAKIAEKKKSAAPAAAPVAPEAKA